MQVLQTLWRLLNSQQRRQLIALQLLSVMVGLSTVGGIAAVLPFFTVLADPRAAVHNPLLRALLDALHLEGRGDLVVVLGVAFAAAVFIANAVSVAGLLAINRFALRVGDLLCVRLFEEYLHLEYEFHTRHDRSSLSGKIRESARVTASMLQQGLTLVTNVVVIVCLGAAVVILNPVVAIGAVGGLGGSYALIYVIARRRLLRGGRTETRSHAERARTIDESLGAIREVKLVHAGDLFVQRFAEQSQAISHSVFNALRVAYVPKYLLEFATVSCLVGVALYLRRSAGATGPWVAQLGFVGFAAYRLLPALQQVFAAMVKIRADRAAFAGIEIDLAGARATRVSQRSAVVDPSWRGRPRRELRACNLTFRYGSDRPPAVSGVSLVIPAGTLVGFVGPNGSGKSTLLDLLSALLTPQTGYLEVDGIRIEHSNRADWQSVLAYVPQHPFLFNATLAENIALGVAPAQIDWARLEHVGRLARLTEYVAALPHGYHENLGDAGSRLSGGQRQRVVIARALYRDAALVILDEATSGLDIGTEAEIVETLAALQPKPTVLLSTHRSRALQYCDLVFELREGAVVSREQHERFVTATARAADRS